MTQTPSTTAVAVYCASSAGKRRAFQHAAASVGKAVAKDNRTLVFGGGRKGLMGTVSDAVLEAGGKVTGVMPHAMIVAGGEKEAGEALSGAQKALSKEALAALFDGRNRPNEETVIVDSMHERKLEMAKRSCGFICLPGGNGTFEELFEVTTWSQLGIHNKPIIIINVLSYYEPLRQLIRNGVEEGFITAQNEGLITFVDGPADQAAHDDFDWGKAALDVLNSWQPVPRPCYYDWSRRREGSSNEGDRSALGSA